MLVQENNPLSFKSLYIHLTDIITYINNIYHIDRCKRNH